MITEIIRFTYPEGVSKALSLLLKHIEIQDVEVRDSETLERIKFTFSLADSTSKIVSDKEAELVFVIDTSHLDQQIMLNGLRKILTSLPNEVLNGDQALIAFKFRKFYSTKYK